MEKLLNRKSQFAVMRIIPVMLVMVMAIGMIPVSAKTKKAQDIPTVEVYSLDELVKRLNTDGEEKIIFSTDEAVSVTIPSGKYSGKKHLVIRAANASVTNKAKFVTVNIEAIIDYTEKVSGNNITVSCDGACIIVNNKKKVAKLTIDAGYVGVTVRKNAKIKNLVLNHPEDSDAVLETMLVDEAVLIGKEVYENYLSFSEVIDLFNIARTYYYKETDPVKLIEGAARGMLYSLEDPYSYYYDPQEFADMWEDDEGNYVGIGVAITANYNKNISIISQVFKGGPAEKAGVQRDDILYRIGEDFYVTAENLDKAVQLLRGVPGTDVDVTFLRNGKEITYTITRNEVKVNETESTMIDGEIGYIVLYQFAGSCETDFEKELNDLVLQGAKGIIIDLRDNPGGWVDQAQYIADLFMDEGELCYLVYNDGSEDHNIYPTTDGKVEVKLVVLVNENSASSSEILTGALRDCAEASVVGVKSFGKGIVQGVYGVGTRGAGYQLTIAQYFTPNGTAVHGIGITPDYIVELPKGDNGTYKFADTENDVQLKKAIEVMKDKLQ